MTFASAEASSEASVQLCAFHVGATEYVIDLKRVEEILRPQPITPLPQAPNWIEGVVSLRGNLLPVVNLRLRLGVEQDQAPRQKKHRLLVCWIGRRRVGFVVDRVSEVLRMGREELRPPPPLLSAGAASYVVGVCGPPDRLRLLLNLKALLIGSDPEGGATRSAT